MGVQRGRESDWPVEIAGKRYYIPSVERDRALLQAGTWPTDTEQSVASGWKARKGHLFRRIAVYGEGEETQPQELWEALLRFPNSPIYATHRSRRPPFKLPPWPNLHTMRIIGAGSGPGTKIKHVYLLHNGLNETVDLMFHYRLAAWILGTRPDAVCILRPLPGHLSRFPFSGTYAELPLDNYLRDPASLFRQFLRYMQETQWLLSALVPRSHYAVTAGTRLLGEVAPRGADPKSVGRALNTGLARAISQEWNAAFTSTSQVEARKKISYTHSKQRVTRSMIESAVGELRQLLGWKSVVSSSAPRALRASGRGPVAPESPSIHVVGYSMGGFMAQAVFFAWPFAVASCTNLFAGGALRDLAPTAFAHPEEWQAVLHGLRYELDRAFREKFLIASRDGRVAGISEDVFGYFTRVFYEVYLQYYRGGYASRVAEFSRRMLFVVGGDDPIVRTKNVLDAGPPRGMTLLQVADVSHFPGGRPREMGRDGKVESEQRRYWLPEVGRIIANFSEQSEHLLNRTLAESWRCSEQASEGESDEPEVAIDLTGSTQLSEQDPTMLSSPAFASELKELVDCSLPAEGGAVGWLLVSRNEISPVFLGPDAMRFYAQAIHHSEDQIAQYIRTLRARSKRLLQRPDRVSLLIPAEARDYINSADQQTFFAKSETPSAARIPDDGELANMWDWFQAEWIDRGTVGKVTAGEYEPGALDPVGPIEADRLEIDKLPVTILPDVWIALSHTVGRAIRGSREDTREGNEDAVLDWAVKLTKDEQEDMAELKTWIDNGEVLAITVSGAELNPRYRGHRLLARIRH